MEGDVLLSVDGAPVNSLADLTAAVNAAAPHHSAEFEMSREGVPLDIAIPLWGAQNKPAWVARRPSAVAASSSRRRAIGWVARKPRVSVSRSIFALVDDRDRAYFGRGRDEDDQIGFIDEKTRAIFGRG
jgi:hypothetical protein